MILHCPPILTNTDQVNLRDMQYNRESWGCWCTSNLQHFMCSGASTSTSTTSTTIQQSCTLLTTSTKSSRWQWHQSFHWHLLVHSVINVWGWLVYTGTATQISLSCLINSITLDSTTTYSCTNNTINCRAFLGSATLNSLFSWHGMYRAT